VPIEGQAPDAERGSGGAAVSATGLKVINQLVAPESTTNTWALELLRPVTETIGRHLADVFQRGITAGEVNNIASHINSVRDVGGVEPNVNSSQKAKNVAEWAAASAETSEKDNPELASAWRAALEGILRENDYGLIDVVKRLNRPEVEALLQMLDIQREDREFHDPAVGERLKGLGLAMWGLLQSRVARRLTKLLILLVCAGGLLLLIPYYQDVAADLGFEFNPRNYILWWAEKFIITLFFTVVALGFAPLFWGRTDRLSIYLLTPYGRTLADRIERYFHALKSRRPEV
jgi:hypothetical protein